MWINVKDYRELVRSATEAQGMVAGLSRSMEALQVNLDWMRLRINQLEMERAELYKRVTSIRLPVPEIQSNIPVAQSSRSGNALMPPITREELEAQMKRNLNEMPSFEDPGDEKAEKMGIFNNSDGTVRYE